MHILHILHILARGTAKPPPPEEYIDKKRWEVYSLDKSRQSSAG